MTKEKNTDPKEFDLTPGENEKYKPVKADLVCPHCKKKSTMTLRACVNVSLHPEEKQQVLDGSFFQYTCPACGEKISISYPILYDDMGKALMIYLLPDETEVALEKLNAQQSSWSEDMLKAATVCTMRAVRNINELCEKIKIYDAGLDDRYVELTKAFVFAQFIKQQPDFVAVQVLYDRQNEEGKIPPRRVEIESGIAQNYFKYICHYITPEDYEAAKAFVADPEAYDFKKILKW